MGTGDSYIRSCAVWSEELNKPFLLVNIVNHPGLLSALKRGETTADTLISESIYFLSLSRVIHLTDAAIQLRHAPSSVIGNKTPPQKFCETSTKCETPITLCGHKAKAVFLHSVLNYVIVARVGHCSHTHLLELEASLALKQRPVLLQRSNLDLRSDFVDVAI